MRELICIMWTMHNVQCKHKHIGSREQSWISKHRHHQWHWRFDQKRAPNDCLYTILRRMPPNKYKISWKNYEFSFLKCEHRHLIFYRKNECGNSDQGPQSVFKCQNCWGNCDWNHETFHWFNDDDFLWFLCLVFFFLCKIALFAIFIICSSNLFFVIFSIFFLFFSFFPYFSV